MSELKIEQNFGVSGEFQVIVRRADGSVKFDSGMQPNLMLDNALLFYYGERYRNSYGAEVPHYKRYQGIIDRCVVGSGNTPPTKADVALQSFVAVNSDTKDDDYFSENPETDKHPNYLKRSYRRKFIFDGINNENISEVGLAAYYGTHTTEDVKYENDYYLMTRALLKGQDGDPITVTVLKGEVLEIIYQINLYIDIRRKTGEFTLTVEADGETTNKAFEYAAFFVDTGTPKYIYDPIIIEVGYHHFYSWGAKETEEELNPDLDLSDADGWGQFGWNKHSIGSDYVDSGSKSSSVYESNAPYDGRHAKYTVVAWGLTAGQGMLELDNGIYTHNHANGIRMFQYSLSQYYTSVLTQALVIVKDKETGGGINKNDRQRWKLQIGFSISRYEES